jgi:quinol monooxygenase YgiN
MEQALEAAQAIIPHCRTEPGTLEYVVYRGVEDPNMLVFFEKYQDAAAQAAHMETEATKALQAAIMPCLAGEPVMGVLEEVASA